MAQEYVGWLGGDGDAEEGFPVFNFEANRAFGRVTNRATLERVLIAYPWAELLTAPETIYPRPVGACPEFGFRAEHRGGRTLGDYLRSAGYPVLEVAQEGE